MRRLLLALLLSAGWTLAQEATPSPSPVTDRDLQAARQTAENALDILYSDQAATVADMMDPEPPKWKGSPEKLHRIRTEDLQLMAQTRGMLGLRLARECTRATRVAMPGRPAAEEYFQFTFKSTYPDQQSVSDLLTIVKKDGKFYVERVR